MACFLVPAAEAVVTTIITKAVKAHEMKTEGTEAVGEGKVFLSKKLGRLSGFLWGGSGLLAFEHLWHGEITPFFPFLTAANDPAQMSEALHEMSTAGVLMAVLVTAFWAALSIGEDIILKRTSTGETKEESA